MRRRSFRIYRRPAPTRRPGAISGRRVLISRPTCEPPGNSPWRAARLGFRRASGRAPKSRSRGAPVRTQDICAPRSQGARPAGCAAQSGSPGRLRPAFDSALRPYARAFAKSRTFYLVAHRGRAQVGPIRTLIAAADTPSARHFRAPSGAPMLS